MNDETTRLSSSADTKQNASEEVKEPEKKEEECFTTDEEKNLYLEIIDLKDYVPEILLIPQKKVEKSQSKTENTEDAGEQTIQVSVLNSNKENPQNTTECNFFFIYKKLYYM